MLFTFSDQLDVPLKESLEAKEPKSGKTLEMKIEKCLVGWIMKRIDLEQDTIRYLFFLPNCQKTRCLQRMICFVNEQAGRPKDRFEVLIIDLYLMRLVLLDSNVTF